MDFKNENYKKGYAKGYIVGQAAFKRLQNELDRSEARYDNLLKVHQKLMIHSVHQQDRIDNLECYLSFYLKS